MTSAGTTLLHVTHWKAGSQWIYAILRACAGERVVTPQLGVAHVLGAALQPGRIYPTAYLTRQQFLQLERPAGTQHFLVFRDLRDTLVSGYFSMRHSHPEISPRVTSLRSRLSACDLPAGLRLLMQEWLPLSAAVQRSWLAAAEPFLRYEDLLSNDVELLEATLLDRCGLDVPREHLRQAVLANRFEARTGRRPGEERLDAHERLGVAGDWRRHFDAGLKADFNESFGDLLIASGYETSHDW
ncbi:MAG: hypothetical protein ACT4PU_08685 [Planctomycetota bacterium]